MRCAACPPKPELVAEEEGFERRLCVAGIGGDGVLNTMVDHVVGSSRDELRTRSRAAGRSRLARSRINGQQNDLRRGSVHQGILQDSTRSKSANGGGDAEWSGNPSHRQDHGR